MHKGDNLSPLSESGSSCYGATVPPPLAPHRPSTEKGDNLSPFSGLMQPRGKRKRGKFDRVLQREPKCAPLR
jgi:hypothetical protein